MLSYDQFGLPVVTRIGASVGESFTPIAPSAPGAVPPAMAHALGPHAAGALKSAVGNAGAAGGTALPSLTPYLVAQYSVTQDILESQRAALSAQAQLQADVGQIEALNKVRKAFNDLVVAALEGATGEQVGDRSKDWKGWLAKRKGYAADPPRTPRKPTLDQLVPLAYNPSFGQLMVMNLPTPPDNCPELNTALSR
jgi:hypothetical protein